jgi:hypothetical protein
MNYDFDELNKRIKVANTIMACVITLLIIILISKTYGHI